MKSTILNDSFTLDVELMSGSGKSQPLFKGVLYEELTDDFGKPLLKKIGENTVVLGGAITALYKLCGTNAECQFIPDSLDNKSFSLSSGDTAATAAQTSNRPTLKEFTSTIALFGVGIGGHSVDGTASTNDVWNAVAKKDIKRINVPALIPMRRAATLTGPVTSTGETDTNSPDAPTHYFMKRPATEGAENTPIVNDGKPVYDYFMKEIHAAPVIRTHWKDSTDEEGLGTEVVSDVSGEKREEGLVSYAEFTLHFGENDVREYFVESGQLGDAHFNSIGLFTGNKVQQDDGSYEYEDVRLFSYLNIDTKSVRVKTDATYRYRIFAIV